MPQVSNLGGGLVGCLEGLSFPLAALREQRIVNAGCGSLNTTLWGH